MMQPEEYRSLLTEMVKAAGAEVQGRAAELVGDMDLISGFQIVLDFPQETAVPTIEVRRKHMSKKAFEVYRGWNGRRR